jgi:hypothetical protein
MTPPIVKVPPADDEFTIGQELANAAVAAGVEHVVFSGLENVEARTANTKWAPHFTDKARVEVQSGHRREYGFPPRQSRFQQRLPTAASAA